MKTSTFFRWTLVLAGLALSSSTTTAAEIILQDLVDQAPEHGEVAIPAGVWKQAVVIEKPLKLRGASTETTILEVTADGPALRIRSQEPVLVESLTIRWQRATSERPREPLAAIATRDTPLTLRSVRLQAPGNNLRCPAGLLAMGFSELQVEECLFEGFEFTMQFLEGAKGSIKNSIAWKPGHAAITAGPQSEVQVSQCIVAGSAFHGLRCTGGRLVATDNLVVSNKNRGFYLGNRSATGLIRNNVIWDNGTGIRGFAQSNVEVANNVIGHSEYAALDARDTCRLKVHDNILLENTRGLVLFKESGTNKNQVGANLSWANKTESENFEPAPEMLRVDPQLTDAGDFRPRDPASTKGYGLVDPEPLARLWQKWLALSRN